MQSPAPVRTRALAGLSRSLCRDCAAAGAGTMSLSGALEELRSALERFRGTAPAVQKHARGRVLAVLDGALPAVAGQAGDPSPPGPEPAPASAPPCPAPSPTDDSARILAFLESHPGASARSLRCGVPGDNRAVDEALARLMAEGRVRDAGSEGRRAYVAVQHAEARPQHAQHGPGDTSGSLETDRPSAGAPGARRLEAAENWQHRESDGRAAALSGSKARRSLRLSHGGRQ